MSTDPADEAYIDSDKVKKTVKNLYSSDPHKFFVTLEDEAW